MSQEQEQPFNGPRIVDTAGRPLSSKAPETCPRCGSGKGHRVMSAGFGNPHPVCTSCGYEFKGASE
jgi:uncharacterized protein (DUF983 family)